MARERANLAELAGVPQPAKIPEFARSAPARAVRTDQVAPNPHNTRVITEQDAIAMAASLTEHGQLQACVVVNRAAFLALWPDCEREIGSCQYVQVTGGRRLAGALRAKRLTIDVQVKDALAESRAKFLAATAAENLDRENLNPIDEAGAVRKLVEECGSQKSAAERLGRSAPWVHQRLNLLNLTDELQQLVRAGAMPVHVGREIGRLSQDEQTAAWQAAQVQQPSASADEDAGGRGGRSPASTERGRPDAYAGAIKRLGGSGPKIAESLFERLDADEIKALMSELRRLIKSR